ncbi:DegV family EDD domain-containing protein [Halosquirtibacter xylanolyticus]|uniref:DegV family protein n=1 Tax=Halosquirtibacter xylanolyticus TaxID=3374599 RepID=UPI003749670D|nr:DegV family EDD domain-containing protein [Prolixibacteraceae bacterium]
MLTPLHTSAISGLDLYYAFKNGTKQLNLFVDEINQINVFPVRDADTGTNLYATTKSILDNTIWVRDLKSTIKSISSTAIENAKGNSGSIVALYLRGIHRSVDAFDGRSVSSLSEMLGSAYLYVYQKMSAPQEGTILTMMRVWAEQLRVMSNAEVLSIAEAMRRSVFILREALEETKNQLEILSKVNVVDAGALGFVCFIEGMLKPYRKGKTKRYTPSKEMLFKTDDVVSSPAFQYCYEVNIVGASKRQEEINSFLSNYGDSIICTGDEERLHVHIHTDCPTVISKFLSDEGVIEKIKVDDLQSQYYRSTLKKEKYALVVDSTCDLSDEQISKYHIYKLPMPMEVNGHQHLDGITITGKELYEDMQWGDVKCQSSQVSQGFFENFYRSLLDKYDHIISLHISKHFSGTYTNALAAANEVSCESSSEIDVWDSGTLSAAYGMMVERIAMAAVHSAKIEDLRSLFQSLKTKIDIMVSVRSLDAMVKSGRVPISMNSLANKLGLHPMVSMSPEGRAKFGGVVLGFNRSLNRMVRRVAKKKVKRFQVVHVGADFDAVKLEASLNQKLRVEHLPYIAVTPVIGVYAGLGSVGVVVEYE